MSVITLPSVPRPEPLRPAPRSTDMSGASSLATAQNNAAASAMNFGVALIDLMASKGQSEYNEALVKYKTAEMEKMAEIQATPIEALEEEDTGTSHDLIDKQTIMKALPNTNALRDWRKNYLNNELLPTMKSNKAKQALKLKSGQDAVQIDRQFIEFDYKRNKARLADSYGEKANVYMASGDRNEYRATVLEAEKIGVYNAQEADDILDSGFALMHQNDVLTAAMKASFSRDGYGNEKIGKEIISKSLSFESYDGSEKALNDKEVMKLFDDKFKDQRNNFVNATETRYRQAEDLFMQKLDNGTLSRQEVLDTFEPIKDTSGRDLQRFFLTQLDGKDGEGDLQLGGLYKLFENNRYLTEAEAYRQVYDYLDKNKITLSRKQQTELAGVIKFNTENPHPDLNSIVSVIDKKEKELVAMKDKTKSAELNTILQSFKESVYAQSAKIGRETDPVKKETQMKALVDYVTNMSGNVEVFKVLTNTPAESGGKAVIMPTSEGGYDIQLDKDFKTLKENYNPAIELMREGKNIKAQVQEYEGAILKNIGINNSRVIVDTDANELVHRVPAAQIRAANLFAEKGEAIVKIAENEKGKTVIQYFTKSGQWQTYDDVKPNKTIPDTLKDFSGTEYYNDYVDPFFSAASKNRGAK